jgi:defect-in-organelle-trafficking protein DotD
MRKATVISIIALGIILSACTPVQHRPSRGETLESASAPSVDVDTELKSVAFSVQHSLRTLAASKEPHELNAINTKPLVTIEGGMGQRATIDWSGPIEPLLHRLAHMSRYNVKVLGPTPPIPVVVTMMVENRQIADIVKDAGLQAGRRANLVVYPSSRIIELRYIPT